MANRLLEKYVQVVRSDGIKTNKNVVIGATASANLTVNGTFTQNGIANTAPATLAAGATVSFTPTTIVTKHTPASAETINFSAPVAAGTEVFLEVVTSGVTAYVVTFGSNTKSQGTLSTGTTSGATFLLSFVSDGTNWVESSRTAAM